MGTRRYAKSGLGFLLAFALITGATPAAAGLTGESAAGQGDAAQQAKVQQEAASSATSAPTKEPAESDATAAADAGSSTSAEAAEPAVPEAPVVEEEPESQPATTPVETQETTGSTIERTSGPVAAPTQADPPASPAEETAEPAPEPQNMDTDPATRPSDITVKVYKMVTGLDGGSDRAVPKAGWEFSLAGGSLKSGNASATTDENGLAVFSGEDPGNSGKANVTINESDPSLSDYDLVQQAGKNAVCSAGGEAVEVENSTESGFQIKAVAGETVTCTVYNRPLAAELILVNNVKDGIAGTAPASGWNLTATPEMTSSETVTATGTPAGENFEVAHGTYKLTQSTGPANYTWLSLKCSTDGGPATDIDDFAVRLTAGTETTCTFTNAYQGIDIDKRAWDVADGIREGGYPDALLEFDDGALVPFGTTVTWTYTVTNTGGTAINGIAVDDDMLAAAVTCPESSLDPGGSMICTAAGQLTS